MTSQSDWSAEQYLRFEADRTRPVRDLLAACPARPAATAVDLGCGPGNSTEILAERLPLAAITGLDSSPDMIAAARSRLPSQRFVLGDITSWQGTERYDFILSNAVLNWVGDHANLLPRLAGRLNPGGTLAIQIPDNLDEPAQTLMQLVAQDGPWADKLATAADARTPPAAPDWYYRLLRPHCPRVDIWRTTYVHALPGGVDAIVAWFSSTGLRPFLAPLDAPEQAAFLARYRAALAAAYPVMDDGCVLLAMPRIFLVAG